MPSQTESLDGISHRKRIYKKPTEIVVSMNRENFFDAFQRDYNNGKWLETRLINIGRRAGFNRNELEEIIGDFWLELWERGFHSFDGRISPGFDFSGNSEERAHLFKYLVHWFLNRAKDYRRGEYRRRFEVIESNLGIDARTNPNGNYRVTSYSDMCGLSVDPSDRPLFAAEYQELVQKYIRKLPKKYLEIIELAYFHGFKYREIAGILNIQLGTVKSRLHQAVEVLGNLIKSDKTVYNPRE